MQTKETSRHGESKVIEVSHLFVLYVDSAFTDVSIVTRTKIIFEHQKEASTSRFTLRNQTPSVNIGESVFIFFWKDAWKTT